MTSASPYSDAMPSARATVRASAANPAARRNHVDLDALPQREPRAEEARILHGAAPAAESVVVLLQQQALRQLEVHVDSDTVREVGGVLLGHAYRHKGQIFVEVKAALPAVSDDHGPFHFTFNADAWSQIHRDRATRHPDLDIVGWFHTHPALGVFYSADDVIVHSAAFVMPWHVGLVVDPLRQEAAFFGWVHGDISPLPGFYEIKGESNESTLAWRGVKTAVWEETYEAQLSTRAPGKRLPEHVMQSTVNPWLGVIVGALGIILSLGLLIGGILPLYEHSRAMERVAIALSEENLARASAAGTASCPDGSLRLLTPLAGQIVSAKEQLNIVGIANHPDAAAYELAVRLAGEQEWFVLNTVRRDIRLGELAQWNIATIADGPYQIRLAAQGSDKQPLSGVTPCTIDFSLARAPAE